MVNAVHGEEPMQIFDSDTMNAPWGIVTKLKTAVSAIQFFNPQNLARSSRAIGREPDGNGPLSFMDFVRYLEKTNAFEGRKPNLMRVVQVLDPMTREGFLQNFGSHSGEPRVFNDCFLFMSPASGNRERVAGQLWLAAALGPELLYYAVGHGVVQITGCNSQGDERAGTGVVVAEHTILTARHVVEDMQVHQDQVFQHTKCTVRGDRIKMHDVQDVAFITVEQTLRPVSGLILHPPRVGQKVFVLGYPAVPLVCSAPLVMHSGEVTAESVRLANGERAFLYSATTRPGNSGGPVISADGYLLGLASKDLTMKAEEDWFAPHYAGVDANTVLTTVTDLGLKVDLAFEGLE